MLDSLFATTGHDKNAKACSRCLYTESHPLGLILDSNGLCSGCRVHDEKYSIDWEERLNKLKAYFNLQSFKNVDGLHDCVVYVDSDAESFYTVYLLKNVLGLEPLLVTFNDYFRTDIGFKNINTLRTHFNCDLLSYSIRPSLYKNLIRESMVSHNNIMWPALAAKTALPVKIAHARGIPTVVWGAHQGMEQVGMFSHHDFVEMSQWYRDEHDLFGVSLDSLCSGGSLVARESIPLLHYPDPDELIESGLKGIYLNNYFKWDPIKQNQKMIQQGYTPEWNSGSFDYFDRSGSSVYYEMHDACRLKRVGYAKIRDHVCREIRHGRINREQGQELERLYLKRQPDITSFFNWLGVSTTGKIWMQNWVTGEGAGSSSASTELDQIPEGLKEFCHYYEKPKKKFCIFEKSLYLNSQQ